MQGSNLKTKFRFLSNIATGDIAFEAFGNTYSELFESAGLALESAMVDLSSLEDNQKEFIVCSSNNERDLLYDFLCELVYIKDTKNLLFKEIECVVKKENKSWKLETRLSGDKIDPKKHKLEMDVKAVTKHLFMVESLPNKLLHCQVILDI